MSTLACIIFPDELSVFSELTEDCFHLFVLQQYRVATWSEVYTFATFSCLCHGYRLILNEHDNSCDDYSFRIVNPAPTVESIPGPLNVDKVSAPVNVVPVEFEKK